MNFKVFILKYALPAFVPVLLGASESFSQKQTALKCNEDAYIGLIVKDDSKWNSLIINACKCLNNQEYKQAKDYLVLAVKSKPGIKANNVIRKDIIALNGIIEGHANDTSNHFIASHYNSSPPEKVFTGSEMEVFHTRGIQKMRKFEVYLNKISSKETGATEAVRAIGNTLKLFDNHEEHYVRVTNSNNPESKVVIRKYLERARALNYDKVEVEFADFLYVSKLRYAPDGNFYGFIKFRQKFKGIKDNVVVYEDVTDKVVAVILKPYLKAEEGEYKKNYEVLLGDITVSQFSRL